MKGYRTPSWFRMKGFTHKKREKPGKTSRKDGTIRRSAGK